MPVSRDRRPHRRRRRPARAAEYFGIELPIPPGFDFMEDRTLLSTFAAGTPLASVAVPIAIGAPISGNLSQGGTDFYQIQPNSDGRLIAQTYERFERPAAPAVDLRRPGQPARFERRPVVRTARTR